jgi:hypothetical protein
MMSAEEYLKKMQDPKWYGEQDENGTDLSLIRANLELTPEERLLRGDRARRSALELLEYGRQYRAKRRSKDRESLFQLDAIKRLRDETGKK